FSLSHLYFPNVPAPPRIYPLSLHAALPISCARRPRRRRLHARRAGGRRAGRSARDRRAATRDLRRGRRATCARAVRARARAGNRSEEHTSELQSRGHLVCRLLLEKKKVSKV